MPVTMDGDEVAVGDRLYDICLGAGEVTQMLTAGRFSVRFLGDGREQAFTGDGMSPRSHIRTLYWHDPVIVVPRKSDARWDELKRIGVAVAGVLA